MSALDNAEIEALAYQIWEQRGRPTGPSHADWLQAERQLAERQAATPATPATATPDVVPANAEEKWLADIELKQEFEAQS